MRLVRRVFSCSPFVVQQAHPDGHAEQQEHGGRGVEPTQRVCAGGRHRREKADKEESDGPGSKDLFARYDADHVLAHEDDGKEEG